LFYLRKDKLVKSLIGRLTEFLVNRLGLTPKTVAAVYATIGAIGVLVALIAAIVLAYLQTKLFVILLAVGIGIVALVAIAAIIFDVIEDEITVRKPKDK
jgi:hypothetical protein